MKHSQWKRENSFIPRTLQGSERALHALKHNNDALLLLCEDVSVCHGFPASHPSAIHRAVPQGLCKHPELAEEGVLSSLGWRWVPLWGEFQQRGLPGHPSLSGSTGATIPFLRSGRQRGLAFCVLQPDLQM